MKKSILLFVMISHLAKIQNLIKKRNLIKVQSVQNAKSTKAIKQLRWNNKGVKDLV